MKTIAECAECDGCKHAVVKHSREWSGHCSVPVRIIYCKLAECDRNGYKVTKYIINSSPMKSRQD